MSESRLIPNPLQLTFNDPVREDNGEDADPVVFTFGSAGAMGVFDGLGGAGAATYAVGEQIRSGAYVASRESAQTFEQVSRWILRALAGNVGASFLDDIDGYQKCFWKWQFSRRLTDEAQRLVPQRDEATQGKLQSRMIRTLPTTIAAMFYGQDGNAVDIGCLWAGDSRCYLFTPDNGLQQLTDDDQKHPTDALRSLVEDTVMSNCLNADGDFQLNWKHILRLESPLILVAATDGCFQYLLSPAHLEHVLLVSLQNAKDMESWRDEIRGLIAKDRGDDASMAIVGLGWKDFSAVRTSFASRLDLVKSKFIDPVDQARQNENSTDQEQADFQEVRLKTWDEYKLGYNKYLRDVEIGVPR
ncbi:MAG: protein phosphatase 2C domain-containing protein [Armatimonadetes bacterium]|nr:protein phosphatase 2C domain-containing protein [Armatimonadota bacterium]